MTANYSALIANSLKMRIKAAKAAIVRKQKKIALMEKELNKYMKKRKNK